MGAIAVLAAALAGCSDVRDGVASVDPDSGAPRTQVVGGTTITQVPMFRADGSPSYALESAETVPVDSQWGFLCREEPLFGGLDRCGAPRTDWILSFCAVQEGAMYCPKLPKAGGFEPIFTTAPVSGEAPGGADKLPGQVPWAVELSDGSRCSYGSGPGSARPNAYARYDCDGGAGSLWQIDGRPVFSESAQGWTAQAGGDSPRPPLRTVEVRTAIFLTAK